MRRVLRIAQRRGSWVADVKGGTGAWEIVDRDDPRIAVIIADRDGRFDFPNLHYETHAKPDPIGAWWLRRKHEEWRSLLGEGRPFVVREAASFNDAGAPTAGRKKGVWKMTDLTMNDEVFSFRIADRLGEVE